MIDIICILIYIIPLDALIDISKVSVVALVWNYSFGCCFKYTLLKREEITCEIFRFYLTIFLKLLADTPNRK